MPSYYYSAANADGDVIRASTNAASLPALASHLDQQGWRLTRVQPQPVDPALLRASAGVSEGELTTFLRQLAGLLQNGVSVAEALGLQAREANSPQLQGLLIQGPDGKVFGAGPFAASLPSPESIY